MTTKRKETTDFWVRRLPDAGATPTDWKHQRTQEEAAAAAATLVGGDPEKAKEAIRKALGPRKQRKGTASCVRVSGSKTGEKAEVIRAVMAESKETPITLKGEVTC